MSDQAAHSVPGYQVLAVLHQGERAVVLRCKRLADSQSVILKRMTIVQPSAEDFARLRREANLLQELGGTGSPRYIDCSYLAGQWTIITEDIGGHSLQKLIAPSGIDSKTAVEIGLKICDALADIHAKSIIHKDINPANIIICEVSREVQIIDFDIAARLSKEHAFITSTGLEGTIAYLAPEQTGRMNRPIDARADLYSLGITLFELLTGRLPFFGNTPLEMIHSHIAVTAPAPSDLVPTIPKLLSNIVLKLLEKEPKARYQSAEGLHYDLKRCLPGSDNHTDQPLGLGDPKGNFEISRKLYGREADVKIMIAAFERAANGQSGLLLVAGSSGIGKSMVVAEIKKPIVARGGNFIAGKFDQYQRNQPYQPFIQAFRSLMRTILASSTGELAWWRGRIKDALGDHPLVIAEVVPELTALLGALKPVPTLPPLETTNRFRLVFESFARAVSPSEHPLVLFIDDLQWADGGSLKLIEILASESERQSLLVIGAYRDNEVDESHPLRETLRVLALRGIKPQVLQILPLVLDDVSNLIADTLVLPPHAVIDLATLALHKTGGNPFFLAQLLGLLHERGLIYFDTSSLEFCYDIVQIRLINIADNVVDIVLAKLRRMPPQTINAISYAACLGSEFKLATLADCLRQCLQETAGALKPAMQQDVLFPLDAAYRLFESADVPIEVRYRFSHDRIQQACINLMSEDGLLAANLVIGRLLQQSPSSTNEIFAAASHLFIARQLLDAAEIPKLADLCLGAGRQAVRGAAYEPAFRLFEMGLEVLGPAAWKQHPSLTLELHSNCVQIGHSSNMIDEMQNHYNELLKHCQNPSDYFPATRAIIDSLSQRAKHAAAIDVSIAALKLRGVTFRKSVNSFGALISILKTMIVLPIKSLPKLNQLPENTDKKSLEIMALIEEALPSAFFHNPNLFAVMSLKCVRLMSRDGISEDGVIALAVTAMIHAGALQQFTDAAKIITSATELGKKFAFRRGMLRAKGIGLAFNHGWLNRITSDTPRLEDLADEFREVGDLEWSCLSYVGCMTSRMFTWEHLSNLVEGARAWRKVATRGNHVEAGRIIAVFAQFAANLTGQSADPLRLTGEFMNEEKLLQDAYDAHDLVAYTSALSLKGVLSFICGDLKTAAKILDQTIPYRMAIHTLAPVYPQIMILHTCIGLASEDPGTWSGYLQIIRRFKDHLFIKKIASVNKFNYGWGNYLLRAERARIMRRPAKAIAAYEQAKRLAKETGYFSAYTMVLDRLACYSFETGNDAYGIAQLIEAKKIYAAWGTSVKVGLIDAELRRRGVHDHPENAAVATPMQKNIGLKTSRVLTSTKQVGSELDLESLLKAFQVISSQLNLEKLASDLMRVILENAGADHGSIILVEPGGMFGRVSGAVGSSISINVERMSLQDMTGMLPISIINYVKHSMETLVFDEVTGLSNFEQDPYLIASKPKSIACLPIAQQGELMGVLYLEHRHASGAFRPERVNILAMLAAQGAISLRNTYYVAEVAHRATLEGDLAAAKAVQDALLPSVSTVPGFHILTYYEPADQTGGDWYGYHYDPTTQRAFFQIGDVVGHGVSSALVTGAVCGAMSSFHYVQNQAKNLDLSATVALWVGAGDYAVRATGSRVGREMSMFFLAIDADTGQAAFANAGHRHALHITGNRTRPLLAAGNTLGNLDVRRVHTVTLAPGDRLFFYTDGLIEGSDPRHRAYSNLRRISLILAQGQSMERTKELILGEWRQTRGAGKLVDDCAFMLVEVTKQPKSVGDDKAA